MKMERIIGEKYKLGRKIGSGSFGEIFLATHIQSGEIVAVKIENRSAKHPQLLYEAKLYKILRGGSGVANIKWCGVDGGDNVLVIDLLGPSLEDLFVYCGRKFSLKTVLMLADQMIARIEYMHTKGFLHRDIKPDNFLMGLGRKANQVYVIDFGLAKRYRDTTTHQHIPYRENKNLTGTARYASCNTHLGIEQSCRDDLESIGYVLLYFLRGSLPWQGLKAATKKQKYNKICEKKLSTPIEVLCKSHPVEFASYFHYCHSLTFDQRPDYGFLKRLFHVLFTREGFEFDYVFDWTILKYKQTQRTKPPAKSPDLQPNSRVTGSRAMAMDLDKGKGVNGASYSAEVTDHRGSNKVACPDAHMQFGSSLSRNLTADNPIDKHNMNNVSMPSTSFAPPSASRRDFMKLDGSTDAVNIGRGVGNRAGASSRLMRISSAKQLL
ncbi:hypothetical protein POPTR_018G041000v4 [Populus trichocarpa]|uniref:non-specific serine/threonine protein kinase n=1 Tax=Populus trichocarpa TaxID=3694 RepID=A0A3N7G9E4_POPTR|nr:casein kinase 1-like protein 3 [Populus trichocarpa]KAI5556438.1 hypothetical protein BDE02_18G035500 [Populus trichocarpa]RQP02631.1 hypothetical protein POPTR_018G041000v4 [Populus trichocarpa]|eukprot:XP_024445627.1 casein kinase 1-like protein 3 [Populus trichocarpa]